MPEQRLKRTGVMLAVPADEKKVKKLGDWFYIQPKLNGERCRVIDFHSEPILVSSYGNEFEFLDHIKKEIKTLWNEYGMNLQLDGEIYVHGWERERIDSALRRKVNRSQEVEQLQFHIFDVNCDYPQGERIFFYQSAIKDSSAEFQFLKAVPTYRATTANWMEISNLFINQGYEGSILRKYDYPTYDPRRLTGQMLKFKPTETDEYTILRVDEAISQEGEPKEMVGSFLVQGNDEVPFSVGAGKLTHTERIHLWLQRDTLPGKLLEIKQGKILTTGGIPTCAVAVKVLP